MLTTFLISVGIYLLLGIILCLLWVLNERYKTWLYREVNTDEDGIFRPGATPDVGYAIILGLWIVVLLFLGAWLIKMLGDYLGRKITQACGIFVAMAKSKDRVK